VVAAILFDLDETLIVDEPAAHAAFLATAAVAGSRHDIDVAALAAGARERARELWHAAPTHPYCKRIGMSSWEGLWCRFDGEQAEVRAMRDWSMSYRREAWGLALSDRGVRDDELAAQLGERFGMERRLRHEAFTDALPAIAKLRASHRLALVTNGASCLQREKLSACGLSEYFDVVVASGDLGLGKPAAEIFTCALDQLGVKAGETIMVGDSLQRDVAGASALGMRAVWVNRGGKRQPGDHAGASEVSTLSELPAALRDLA
jgi:phosphoserine phosphatase